MSVRGVGRKKSSNPILRSQRREDGCEFEASLGYIVKSSPDTRAAKRDLVSKK